MHKTEIGCSENMLIDFMQLHCIISTAHGCISINIYPVRGDRKEQGVDWPEATVWGGVGVPLPLGLRLKI